MVHYFQVQIFTILHKGEEKNITHLMEDTFSWHLQPNKHIANFTYVFISHLALQPKLVSFTRSES